MSERFCAICGAPLSKRQKLYCSVSCAATRHALNIVQRTGQRCFSYQRFSLNRVCAICGKPIPSGRINYCSNDCYEKAHRMRKAEGYPPVDCTCVVCGTHFIGRLHYMFCSDDCRSVYYREKSRDPDVSAANRAAFLKRMEDPDYSDETRRKNREYQAKRKEDPEVRSIIYKGQYQAAKKRLEKDPEKREAYRKAQNEATARYRQRRIEEDPDAYRAEQARKAREWRAAHRDEYNRKARERLAAKKAASLSQDAPSSVE